MDITVCICTYNRAEILRQALEDFCSLSNASLINWELLIVDNNSKDKTVEVIKDFDKRLPLRYMFELKQGLSFARNRALRECNGDLIIFVDDDCLVDSNWLNTYFKASKDFPEADYFGGRILTVWPDGRPRWVKDESMALLSGIFGHYDLGEKTYRYTDLDMEPYGGNFALRRRLFKKLGLFRTDLGMSGKNTGYGDETDYIIRAKSHGAIGVYLGEALCYHNIFLKKCTLKSMYNFGVQKGVALVRMGSAKTLNSCFLRIMLYAVKSLHQLLKGRGDRFRQCLINIGIIIGTRNEIGNQRKQKND